MRIGKILSDNNLRLTGSREAILGEFLKYDSALSQPDLEKELGGKFDRVTIYRTISSFVEKGILHKVPDDSGTMKFALCSDECDEQGHDDDHVHFKCNKCGKTSCIENVVIPEIRLPEGYDLGIVNLLLQGVCPECRK